MKEWVEIDGLAYVRDPTGRLHRWKEYCCYCGRRTQIIVEEGRCGPGRFTARTAGSAALAPSADEIVVDNRVHYARCSACGRQSPYPLEFR